MREAVRRLRSLLRGLRRARGMERPALVAAAGRLVATRVALRVLPFSVVLRHADRGRHRTPGNSEAGDGPDTETAVGDTTVPVPDPGVTAPDEDDEFPPDLARAVWAVKEAGNRLFPDDPCLPQALVVHRMYRSRGLPSEIRIGARRDERGRFTAHAWVESRGKVVVGGEVLYRGFIPFSSDPAPPGLRPDDPPSASDPES